MAAQNRDELQTQIDSTFVATLQIADHRAYLKDPQAESLVFRKDVIATETPAGGSVSVNYANKDLATVLTTGNLAVSFTGLENGDVKYLRIQKNAENTVSFTGATDVSPRRTYINDTVTVVFYRVTNKNNTIFVCAESVDFDFQPDLNALETSLLNYIDSTITGGVKTKVVEIGTWNMDANSLPASSFISHDIGDAEKIRNVSVIVRNDAGTQTFKLDSVNATTGLANGYITIITDTTIIIGRISGAFFDSTDFDSTSFNRGWVTIEYID